MGEYRIPIVKTHQSVIDAPDDAPVDAPDRPGGFGIARVVASVAGIMVMAMVVVMVMGVVAVTPAQAEPVVLNADPSRYTTSVVANPYVTVRPSSRPTPRASVVLHPSNHSSAYVSNRPQANGLVIVKKTSPQSSYQVPAPRHKIRTYTRTYRNSQQYRDSRHDSYGSHANGDNHNRGPKTYGHAYRQHESNRHQNSAVKIFYTPSQPRSVVRTTTPYYTPHTTTTYTTPHTRVRSSGTSFSVSIGSGYSHDQSGFNDQIGYHDNSWNRNRNRSWNRNRNRSRSQSRGRVWEGHGFYSRVGYSGSSNDSNCR